MISSETMAETEAFVSLAQRQFEQAKSWDMATLEHGLRKALFSDGCKILEGLLNHPGVLGEHVPAGKYHEKRTRKVHACWVPLNSNADTTRPKRDGNSLWTGCWD